MEYKFFCPRCAERISADESISGTAVTCPICREQFIAPSRPKTKLLSPLKVELITTPKVATTRHWGLRAGCYLLGGFIIYAALLLSAESRNFARGSVAVIVWVVGLSVFRFPHWLGTPKGLLLDSAWKGVISFIVVRMLVAGNLGFLLILGIYFVCSRWQRHQAKHPSAKKVEPEKVDDEKSKWAW